MSLNEQQVKDLKKDELFTKGTDGIIRISFLKSGHVMCAICCSYTSLDSLYVDSSGEVIDICQSCGEGEENGK